MLKGLHQQNQFERIYTFHIDSYTRQFWSDCEYLLTFEQEVKPPNLTFQNISSMITVEDDFSTIWSENIPF